MGILEDMNEKLDRLLAGNGGGGTAPAKDKPKAAAKSKITEAKLQDLVTPLVKDENFVPKLKEVFATFGIKRLGEAKEEQYQGLYDAVTAAKEEYDAEAGDGDGDDDLLG